METKAFDAVKMMRGIHNKIVREPEGVDFIVNSRPLTKKEQEALSNFIKEDKAKRLKKFVSKKKPRKRRASTTKEKGLLDK